MSAQEAESGSRFGGELAGVDYNTIGGGAFAAWGLIHVVVGGVGLALYFTGGTGPMLEFVDMQAAANEQAPRMAELVVQFYQALLLIGLTVTVLGLTLNRRGEPLGLWLNAVLVASIDSFFVWFEVLPGHRPLPVGVVSLGLLVLGVVFCGLGGRR